MPDPKDLPRCRTFGNWKPRKVPPMGRCGFLAVLPDSRHSGRGLMAILRPPDWQMWTCGLATPGYFSCIHHTDYDKQGDKP